MARREVREENIVEHRKNRRGRIKRLRVLRKLIVLAFSIFLSVMANLPSWMKKIEMVRKGDKLVLPIYWLRHYLLGSGESLRVPDYVVREAESVFLTTIRWWNEELYTPEEKFFHPYCVHHSTLYDGRGFYGRPTLFYLVGGFTFRMYPGKTWTDDEGEELSSLLVSANDRYDWHSNEDGQYFSSPIGNGKIATAVIRVAGFLFGEEYFLEKGSIYSVTGEMGISNQLWADMKMVGAAEFDSYFCNVEILQEGYSSGELDCWLFFPDSEENFEVPWKN